MEIKRWNFKFGVLRSDAPIPLYFPFLKRV